jgi:DNA-binding transcriptional LysR family regulator
MFCIRNSKNLNLHITFEALKILDAIARHDSFAAASEELNRVPSALTYSIKKLEQDLGVVLFDRSGYRARLTLLGYELLEGGRALLQQGQDLEHKIRTGESLEPKTISMAYDDVISFEYLEPILKCFFNEFPDISLRLSREILNGCWDALETGRADISIAALSDIPHDSVYQYIPLGHVPFVFVVAASHPLAHVSETLSARQIREHRLVLVSDTSTQLPRLSSGYSKGPCSFVVPTMQAKLLAQLAGLGIGFLPTYMAEPYIEKGLFIEKAVERPKMGGRFVLAWNPGKAREIVLKTVALIEKNKAQLFKPL